MPTFTASASFDERERALVGGDVSGEDVDFRELLFDLADGLQDAGGVAVGGVDG